MSYLYNKIHGAGIGCYGDILIYLTNHISVVMLHRPQRSDLKVQSEGKTGGEGGGRAPVADDGVVGEGGGQVLFCIIYFVLDEFVFSGSVPVQFRV